MGQWELGNFGRLFLGIQYICTFDFFFLMCNLLIELTRVLLLRVLILGCIENDDNYDVYVILGLLACSNFYL